MHISGLYIIVYKITSYVCLLGRIVRFFEARDSLLHKMVSIEIFDAGN